jgi:retron-type reverse transcriptase
MFEQAISKKNLHLAAKKVIAKGGSPGIDGQTVEQFEARLEENLRRLQWELWSGNYWPQPVRRVWIPKYGTSQMRPFGHSHGKGQGGPNCTHAGVGSCV